MMAGAARLPSFDILLDGAPLAAELAEALIAVHVRQVLSQPAACELTFAGLAPDALERAAVAPGASLRVAPRGVDVALFDGRSTAFEIGYGPDRARRFVLRGYDALFVLRNRQPVRAHVGVTVVDLAGELVSDLGLRVTSESPGPVWHRLLQTGTDLDLLTDVAARCGLYLVLEAQTLRLVTLQGEGDPLPLELHRNLLEATLETNSNGVCDEVTTSGWDPWRGAVVTSAATTARRGRSSGAETRASDIGGNDKRILVGGAFQDPREAEARAQAELDARANQAVVLHGTAVGDARLRPGARVQLSGVASKLGGRYVLTGAEHTLDPERGFLTTFSTESPALRPRPLGATMTLGHVTRVDDPEKLGRIQVSLPAYGELESGWLQFMSPGAGSGKGLVAPPDIGDVVLLLVELADAAQGVVLGSLYGETGLPAGHEVMGKEASFCFLSPGGQRIRLDDSKNSVRLENADGGLLEMGPDSTTLRSSRPITIEAPGQRITIRAQFVDFERG